MRESTVSSFNPLLIQFFILVGYERTRESSQPNFRSMFGKKDTALCLYFTQLQFLKLISYALRVMGKAYSFVRSSDSILNSDQRSDLKKLCFFDINWLNLEHRPTAFKREKPRFLCEWLAKFSTLIDYVLARVSTIFFLVIGEILGIDI